MHVKTLGLTGKSKYLIKITYVSLQRTRTSAPKRKYLHLDRLRPTFPPTPTPRQSHTIHILQK